MTRKLYLLLLTLVASGLIAAGCGDDDDDGGDSDEPAQTQEDSGGAAEDTDGGAAEDTDGGAPDVEDIDNADEAIAAAKDQCTQQVEANPQVDDDLKDRFLQLCKNLDSEEDVTKIATEICKAAAEKVPAGAARDQFLQQCDQAGATP